jgi:VWFA-related protein
MARPLLVGMIGIGVGAAALALSAGSGQATSPPEPTPQMFIDTVQVNLINVEVFVTDKAGKSVLGLRKEDFQVFEDGKPMEITNFFAGAPQPRPAPPAEATPAAVQTAAPAETAPPPEQQLWLIVYVDSNQLAPGERAIAIENASILARKALGLRGSQVMVVSHSNSPRVRQTFTTDAAVITSALAAIRSEATNLSGADTETNMIEGMMSRTSIPSGPGSNENLSAAAARELEFATADAHAQLEAIRQHAQAMYERTRANVLALSAFVDSLAGLPGRKVMCYVGRGIPEEPALPLFQRWEAQFGQSGVENGFNAPMESRRYTVAAEIRDLIARANADRVMFYALDASGGAVQTRVSADQLFIELDPGIPGREGMSLQQSMMYLAAATGGELLMAKPQAEARMERAAQDFETYYSLAYAAPGSGDGKTHAITVKVDREGTKLRHRRHYLDKTTDERMVERNLSALLYEAGTNPLEIEVTVGAESGRTDGTAAVPVLVTIPLGKLVLLPEGDSHRGKMTIWLAVKDGEDRVTQPTKRVFPIRIPNASLVAALGQSTSVSYELVMRPGQQTVAVVVRDDFGQSDSAVTVRFMVGSAAPARPGA